MIDEIIVKYNLYHTLLFSIRVSGIAIFSSLTFDLDKFSLAI